MTGNRHNLFWGYRAEASRNNQKTKNYDKESEAIYDAYFPSQVAISYALSMEIRKSNPKLPTFYLNMSINMLY